MDEAIGQALRGMLQAPRQSIDLLHAVFQSAHETAPEQRAPSGNARQQFEDIRTRALCRAGRCRRTQVSNEIGNCEIGFVTHSAYDGEAAGMNGAGDNFRVEGPQVFDAAAAAANDEQIAFGAPRSNVDGGGELLGGARTLHRRGGDYYPNPRSE